MTTASQVAEEVAVLGVVTAFLGCIKSRDKEKMASLVLPSSGATLIRKGEPLYMNMQGAVDRIPWESPVAMDEQIYNSTVRIDQDIAMAWTPYVFYYDGVASHTGTGVWSLWKTDGEWRVAGYLDTARPLESPE